MYGPKVSMLRRLSDFRSGVPVKADQGGAGEDRFSLPCAAWPDWVRWHSSTKTKISPAAWEPRDMWLRRSLT